jgi:hypothetical protein
LKTKKSKWEKADNGMSLLEKVMIQGKVLPQVLPTSGPAPMAVQVLSLTALEKAICMPEQQKIYMVTAFQCTPGKQSCLSLRKI